MICNDFDNYNLLGPETSYSNLTLSTCTYNVLMFTPSLVTAIKAVLFPITPETRNCMSAHTITAPDHSSLKTKAVQIYLIREIMVTTANVLKRLV